MDDRRKQVEKCMKCVNHRFSPQRGVICSLDKPELCFNNNYSKFIEDSTFISSSDKYLKRKASYSLEDSLELKIQEEINSDHFKKKENEMRYQTIRRKSSLLFEFWDLIKNVNYLYLILVMLGICFVFLMIDIIW